VSDKRLIQTLVGVYGFYEKELNEFAIRVWDDAVGDFSIEDLERAFSRHLKDPEAGKWLPKPADIIRQLKGTADEAALIAWGKVLEAVRTRQPLALDGPTGEAIRSLGGASVIARSDESQNGFLQKRFIDAFKAYKARSDEPPLLGNEERKLLPATGAPR
jgi:hypothetical protein